MIVSDSTTLIILNDLNKIDLLEIFERVYIPRKVYEEINVKYEVKLPYSFEVVEVDKDEVFKNLSKILNEGESEAIVLALKRNLPLIIDEKKGRKTAKNLGIKVIGLLGVLYINYEKGKINKFEIEQFLKDAINNGYRISKALLEQFLNNLKTLT
jgi:predicted nucleic acid-binding protein